MRYLIQNSRKRVERFNELWQWSLFLASSQIQHGFSRKIPEGPWTTLLVLQLMDLISEYSYRQNRRISYFTFSGCWKGWDTWTDFRVPLTMLGTRSFWWTKPPQSTPYSSVHHWVTCQWSFRARSGIKENTPELWHTILQMKGVRREDNLLSQSWYFSFITRITELWETYKVNADKWFFFISPVFN